MVNYTFRSFREELDSSVANEFLLEARNFDRANSRLLNHVVRTRLTGRLLRFS